MALEWPGRLLPCFSQLASQAFMKAIAQIAREFHRFAIAENFDGHFGLIHD